MKSSAADIAPFAGFSPEAFAFFGKLARNNEREWFQARKETFEKVCKQPFEALAWALDPKEGATFMTRIYRDVRFAKDKSPYRTDISGMVGGHYLQISAKGLYVGVGLYMPEPPALRKLREAIAADGSGRALVGIVERLRAKGYEVVSHESVTSAPRGYEAGHPRIEFLRMKDIHAGITRPPADLATAKAVERIRRDEAELAPFRQWLLEHVGKTSCG